MITDRIACVLIEDFPLVALLDNLAEVGRFPMVVAERDSKTAPLAAANALARREITTAMTAAQARTRCENLTVLVRDHDREIALARTVLFTLQQVSPTVESNGAGLWYLDAPGLMRLYKNEPGIAARIRAVLHPMQLPVRIGLAGNKLAAWIAARLDADGASVIVPSRSEREFIAPLPFTALPISDDTTQKLYTLGLATIGDLAALPAQEITRRFGHDLLALAEYVRGEDRSPYIPDALATVPSAVSRFDYPLTTREQVASEIRALLDRLYEPLRRTGQGCREIVVTLSASADESTTIRCGLRRATCSRVSWMRQVELALEQQTLPPSVSDIMLSLQQIDTITAEQLLLPEFNLAATAVDDAALDSLRQIAINQSLLPEQCVRLVEPTDTGRTSTTPLPRYTGQDISGLRLYHPPHKIRVAARRGSIFTLGHERVVQQVGPWYLSGHWWDDEFRRWYYDIETDTGGSFLLYYDAVKSGWFLQGLFD